MSDALQKFKTKITSERFTSLDDESRRWAFVAGLKALLAGDQIIALEGKGKTIAICPKTTVNPDWNIALQFEKQADGTVEISALGGCQAAWMKSAGLKEHYIDDSRRDRQDILAKMAHVFSVVAGENAMTAEAQQAIDDLRGDQELPAKSEWRIGESNIIRVESAPAIN